MNISVEKIIQLVLDNCIDIEQKIKNNNFSKNELEYIFEDIKDTTENTLDFLKELIRDSK